MQNLLTAVKEHVGYRHGKLIFSADGQVGFITLLKAERDAQQYTEIIPMLLSCCFSILCYLCILLLLSRLVMVMQLCNTFTLRLALTTTCRQSPTCASVVTQLVHTAAHGRHLASLCSPHKMTSHRVLRNQMPQTLELFQPTDAVQKKDNGVMVSRILRVVMSASLNAHKM